MKEITIYKKEEVRVISDHDRHVQYMRYQEPCLYISNPEDPILRVEHDVYDINHLRQSMCISKMMGGDSLHYALEDLKEQGFEVVDSNHEYISLIKSKNVVILDKDVNELLGKNISDIQTDQQLKIDAVNKLCSHQAQLLRKRHELYLEVSELLNNISNMPWYKRIFSLKKVIHKNKEIFSLRWDEINRESTGEIK